ncbi:MAG: protein-tyrosine-phosphatase [Bacteroidia bacterium]
MEILNPSLLQTISELESELDLIDVARKLELEKLASNLRVTGLQKLIFVCTHNSRRSQLAEIWVNQLSQIWQMDLQAFSAGSESTAFNNRMVKALRDTGFNIGLVEDGDNPIYQLNELSHLYYSKSIGHEQLPKEEFAAVMVCSDADKNCPIIPGVDHRVAIKYEDPKAFDGTELETKAYADKVREIGREMIFLLRKLSS